MATSLEYSVMSYVILSLTEIGNVTSGVAVVVHQVDLHSTNCNGRPSWERQGGSAAAYTFDRDVCHWAC